MSDGRPPVSPVNLVRSKGYPVLLVLAAVIGVIVSFASWCFLELVFWMQHWIFENLPEHLGLGKEPRWWPVPVLLVAGVLVALAVKRLPGNGGHEPADGLAAGGPTRPIDLPGVLLAAVASVGLGLVLGPEAPLIALGTGLGVLAVRALRKDAPDQVVALLAAAASFAAISSLFGSPVIGAIIIIEAAGLGGAMLPVILLPGLLAAGIGSLVFVGMGSLSGLSRTAYSIAPLKLPAETAPTPGVFLWVVVLSAVAAVVIVLIVRLGHIVQRLAHRRAWLVIPTGALAVALIAILFTQITHESYFAVLFSGQDEMSPIVAQAATLSLGTLALIIVFKGVAYGISLGTGRGGPTFPALFLGVVAGLLAGHLPGISETPAVAALMGAATVAMLRLPLSSVVLATIVSQSGLDNAPLIVVGVVVAYVVVQYLDPREPPSTESVGAPPATQQA